MKQNVSETESNWRFRKNVKTCLQNKKAWLFSSDFNFICKDGRVTAATCKYYCSLDFTDLPLKT